MQRVIHCFIYNSRNYNGVLNPDESGRQRQSTIVEIITEY